MTSQIDPTDDTYAEREFKDGRDFLGSDDASLEMGVCAVAAWIVAWLFFKAFFLPVVLLSLAILAWRVFRGQTTPQALWARFVKIWRVMWSLPRRLRMRIWLLGIPGAIADPLVWRRNRVWELATKRNIDKSELQELMHHVTDALVAGVDYRIDIFGGRRIIIPAELEKEMGLPELNRKPGSTVDNTPHPAYEISKQSFAGIVPGVGWLSQVLGAAAVIFLGLFVWQLDRANDNDKRADRAEENAAAFEQAAIQANQRAGQADAMRAQETATARAELEKSRTLATTTQGRLRSLAAREKKRNEEALSGAPVDPGERLRDLADPAAAGAAPPAAADSERSAS